MNGRPVGSLFKRHCAYVPQEDTFVPTLSARETLQVAPCCLSGISMHACRAGAPLLACPVIRSAVEDFAQVSTSQACRHALASRPTSFCAGPSCQHTAL